MFCYSHGMKYMVKVLMQTHFTPNLLLLLVCAKGCIIKIGYLSWVFQRLCCKTQCKRQNSWTFLDKFLVCCHRCIVPFYTSTIAQNSMNEVCDWRFMTLITPLQGEVKKLQERDVTLGICMKKVENFISVTRIMWENPCILCWTGYLSASIHQKQNLAYNGSSKQRYHWLFTICCKVLT